MVSPNQNILAKNLEIISWVILAKTSQKMIVNLLMMVYIYLLIKFTCQHHVSAYVCRVWHLVFPPPLLIEIISIANFWSLYTFFALKHEKQTLGYVNTKFEGYRNTIFISPIYFVGAPVFLPKHWKLLGPERLMPLKWLGMNRVKSSWWLECGGGQTTETLPHPGSQCIGQPQQHDKGRNHFTAQLYVTWTKCGPLPSE